MPFYALRVFEGFEGSDLVLNYVKSQDGHLVIRHESDKDDPRPHWHALFQVNITADAIRKKISRMCPEAKGNRFYSLKVCDDNHEIYERYMCHANGLGDHVIIVSSQGLKYNQVWAQDQNRIFWESRKEFKTKKETKLDTVTELYERCNKLGISSRFQIGEELIEMFREGIRPMNMFYMKGVVNSVNMKIDGVKSDDGQYFALKLSEF